MYSRTRASVVSGVIATIFAGGSVIGVSIATADPDFDVLAECESGNNWGINTGNGYYGGVQFTKGTWNAYGGQQYAEYPHQASKSEQIAVARRVLHGQGYGAWPGCSSSTNWESNGGKQTHYRQQQRHSVKSEVRQHIAHQPVTGDPFKIRAVPSRARDVRVVVGDTLSKIGTIYGKDWRVLFDANKDVVSDPDLIYPGQQIIIPS